MYQHRFCIFWYFGVFFITLQNFAQNIVIVLKFSEKFNLNNSYTISKKEENKLLLDPWHSSKEQILALSWRRPLSYRNQSINLQSKSMEWFLYDNGFRHERVNWLSTLMYLLKMILTRIPFLLLNLSLLVKYVIVFEVSCLVIY